MFKIIPGKKDIGAQISCNIKMLNKNKLKKIKSALQKYGMIYFRKQNLNSKNYIKFAKNFGKLAEYPRLKGLNKNYPKITVVQRKASALLKDFTDLKRAYDQIREIGRAHV